MEFWEPGKAAGWRCKLALLNGDNAASAFCEVSGFLLSFTGCADYWEFVSRLLVLYPPAREVFADVVLTLPSQQWIMMFPADSFARSTIRKLVEASEADDAESLRAARKIARMRILLDEQPPTSVMVQSFLSATATLPPPLERSFCSQTARAQRSVPGCVDCNKKGSAHCECFAPAPKATMDAPLRAVAGRQWPAAFAKPGPPTAAAASDVAVGRHSACPSARADPSLAARWTPQPKSWPPSASSASSPEPRPPPGLPPPSMPPEPTGPPPQLGPPQPLGRPPSITSSCSKTYFRYQ